MAGKKSLDEVLSGELPTPIIRRGHGVRLSTDSEEGEQSMQPQEIEKSRNLEIEKPRMQGARSKVKRIKPGYELREDLIKACKRIAFEEERHIYEVIEEAIEEYLKRRKHNT